MSAVEWLVFELLIVAVIPFMNNCSSSVVFFGWNLVCFFGL